MRAWGDRGGGFGEWGRGYTPAGIGWARAHWAEQGVRSRIRDVPGQRGDINNGLSFPRNGESVAGGGSVGFSDPCPCYMCGPAGATGRFGPGFGPGPGPAGLNLPQPEDCAGCAKANGAQAEQLFFLVFYCRPRATGPGGEKWSGREGDEGTPHSRCHLWSV